MAPRRLSGSVLEALAADVDFWSILGAILEAKMAPKMEEMNLKCEPKNKQEFEVAF